jgi:hypothetical protein
MFVDAGSGDVRKRFVSEGGIEAVVSARAATRSDSAAQAACRRVLWSIANCEAGMARMMRPGVEAAQLYDAFLEANQEYACIAMNDFFQALPRRPLPRDPT